MMPKQGNLTQVRYLFFTFSLFLRYLAFRKFVQKQVSIKIDPRPPLSCPHTTQAVEEINILIFIKVMKCMKLIIIFISFRLDPDPDSNPKLTAGRIRIRNKSYGSATLSYTIIYKKRLMRHFQFFLLQIFFSFFS